MSEEALKKADERQLTASQSQLIWWRFRKHRAAMISLAVLLLFYFVALFAGFFAPRDPGRVDAQFAQAPPQPLVFFDDAGFHFPPIVYGYVGERDPKTLRKFYRVSAGDRYQLRFFVRGDPYLILGLIESDIHFIGTDDPDLPLFLLGTDLLGRDMLSRVIYGGQVSLSVGLVGVFLSLILGILLGGVSGYYGGWLDVAIQRLIEVLRSIPTIPLWLTLSAALPRNLTQLQMYFGITIILSFIGWTEVARVVRGKFMSLRNEDFILAARTIGTSRFRIIYRHMVPSFISHLIAALTLALPIMILSETALSFLGLGLRPPTISWGTLLDGTQNLNAIALTPWLLLPVAPIIVTVLAFNFVGDGLRDAADPYA
ncbi:MAG: ABC transporter permease [Chloroflexi bacterium]|nr:ABC transporter permease [Chloroflexota bacterium]